MTMQTPALLEAENQRGKGLSDEKGVIFNCNFRANEDVVRDPDRHKLGRRTTSYIRRKIAKPRDASANVARGLHFEALQFQR